jgi:hypothetical protein
MYVQLPGTLSSGWKFLFRSRCRRLPTHFKPAAPVPIRVQCSKNHIPESSSRTSQLFTCWQVGTLEAAHDTWEWSYASRGSGSASEGAPADQRDRGGIKQTAQSLDNIGRSFCGSSLGVRQTGAWRSSQHSGWNLAVHRLIICRQRTPTPSAVASGSLPERHTSPWRDTCANFSTPQPAVPAPKTAVMGRAPGSGCCDSQKTGRGRTGDPVVGMRARLRVARTSEKQVGYGTNNREFVDGRLSRPRTVVMALVQ